MALNGSLSVSLAALYTALLDIGSANYPIGYNPGFVFTDGSGANQANKVFTDTRTLAASANESLDLNGVLTDAFGQVLNFTKIRMLLITADPTNVNDVIVGGAASNGFISHVGAATHTNTIKPGGMMLLVAPDVNGYAVTAGTADLLKVANSAGTTGVNYTIAILGS